VPPGPASVQAEAPPVLPAGRPGVFGRGLRALRQRYMAVAGVPPLVLGSLMIQAFCRGRIAAVRGARATTRLAAWLAGLSPRFVGPTLPNTPAILVSNHASWLDGLILTAVFDRPVRLTPKATLFAAPILGAVLRQLGHLPIARGRVELRAHSYRRGRDAAARGDLGHFFPEGTITPTMGLGPFRLGAFRLAGELGVPLVPIAICGSRAVLRDGDRWPSPGEIVVTVLDKIPMRRNASAAEISAARDCARARLAAAVGEPLLNVESAGLPANAEPDADPARHRSARAFRSAAARQGH
jgi:1-acyl-sn-glycerol-3-phosphate acyltransferase